jgi:hypothetical protein
VQTVHYTLQRKRGALRVGPLLLPTEYAPLGPSDRAGTCVGLPGLEPGTSFLSGKPKATAMTLNPVPELPLLSAGVRRCTPADRFKARSGGVGPGPRPADRRRSRRPGPLTRLKINYTNKGPGLGPSKAL